ncbi:glycosyltransferase [Neobacillus pocheonensis]|uniref:glycosyltransferase n=1 Tax=Neobacillus pocheonensis TaxID=363869 RepID=UPI003D2AD4D9
MLISIVTAVYNGQDYLKDCIESILNQTYKDFEYIIVNDGSTDHTKEILDSIQDDRVIVIHSPQNNGAAASLNIGIERASGKWISIQDADDISRPAKIEELLGHLEDRNDLIGISSMIKCIPGKDGLVTNYMCDLEAGYNEPISKEIMYQRRFYTCYICHGTVVFLKDAFQKAGGYNPTYKISYDYDLWLRLFDIMPFEKVEKVLYEYRVTANSLTNNNLNLNRQELLTIASKKIRELVQSRVGREPKFLLIASMKGARFYAEHVIPQSAIQVKKFIQIGSQNKEKQILSLLKHHEIDAVLIMNNSRALRWLQGLSLRGLEINKDLFMIWNVN